MRRSFSCSANHQFTLGLPFASLPLINVMMPIFVVVSNPMNELYPWVPPACPHILWG